MKLNSELARPGYFLLYFSFHLTVQCRFSFDSCLSYKTHRCLSSSSFISCKWLVLNQLVVSREISFFCLCAGHFLFPLFTTRALQTFSAYNILSYTHLLSYIYLACLLYCMLIYFLLCRFHNNCSSFMLVFLK